MSVNKVIILGKLGADPELKFTQSNKAVCNLRIATTSKWRDKATGQMHEETEWHRVTAWGEQGEAAAKYLAKGREVYIEGHLKTSSYDKDGQKRYSVDIQAERVIFVGGGGQGYSRGGNDKGSESPPPAESPPPDDDIQL